jgi:hypothetical protein
MVKLTIVFPTGLRIPDGLEKILEDTGHMVSEVSDINEGKIAFYVWFTNGYWMRVEKVKPSEDNPESVE